MVIFYVISVFIKDASVVDIAWGLGFVLIAWIFYFSLEVVDYGHTLITILVSLWGFRLAWHIFTRKYKDRREDWRYANWREQWGDNFWWRSFFQVFMLQGIFMIIIALPVTIAAANPNFKINSLGWIAITLWIVGFYFEAVGDYQLKRFLKKRKDKNKVMTSGVWRFTRHPNYFGETTMWWALFLLVASLDYGLLGAISPILISYVLLFISMPMLEKKYANNKSFKKYAKRTSIFIPRMPKT